VVMADVAKGFSTNTVAVQSVFPLASFTVGTQYDVYVSSPGGLSAPTTITYS